MKLKNQGKGLGGALLLSMFLAPGVVQAKAAKAKDAEANWYLIINKAMLHTNDKYEKNTSFVDNYNQSTRAGITGEKKLDDCLKVGGRLEVQFLPATSLTTSQINRDAGALENGNNFGIRQADAWIKGDFGQVSLGHGSMSGFTAIGSDLSGTSNTIGYAGPWLMGGGMAFHQTGMTSQAIAAGTAGAANNGPSVAQVFSPYELIFSRQARMRYDTPTFAGFTLSGSIYSGSVSASNALDRLSTASLNTAASPQQKYGTDITLRYAGCFEGVKLLGAVTANRLSKGNGGVGGTPDDLNNMKVWDGSLAALHVDSGINATVNYAQKTLANPGLANGWGLIGANATGTVLPLNYPTQKPKFGRVALGLISNINCYGPTNFIVDYTQTKHNFEDDGKGKAYGFGVVQQLKKVNSEVYVAVRQLKYNTPGISTIKYDRMFQAFAGIRVALGGKLPT